MPWKYNGVQVKPGKSWTDSSGIIHPSNWNIWTDSYKTEMGLVWIEPETKPIFDKRFYYSASIPRSLDDITQVDDNGNPLLDLDGNPIVSEGLKTEWLKKTKKTANDMLEKTDWYVLRELSRGVTVPTEISTYRDAILQSCTDIEIAINNCTTLEEFILLFDTTEGKPTISNWPEEIE